MALQQYIKFAALHQIPMEQRFPDLLVLLLSTRPDVCSDALDSSQEFLALAVEVLHVEFFDYAREKTKIADPSLGATVSLCIHKILQYDGVFQVPLSLLQSICVILGIYHDQGNSEVVQPSTSLVSDLANALLHQDETFVDDSNGLASAIFVESGVIAISVESVRLFNSDSVKTLYEFYVLNNFVHIFSHLCLHSGSCWQKPEVTLLLDVQRFLLQHSFFHVCFFVLSYLDRRLSQWWIVSVVLATFPITRMNCMHS